MDPRNDEILGLVIQAFQDGGIPFGGLDLALTSRAAHDEVVLAHVLCLLIACTAGATVFDHVRVVLPAGVSDFVGPAIRARLRPEDVEDALARLAVVKTVDRSAGALVQAAAGVPVRSAIVCGYLELYASDPHQVCQPDTEQEGLLHGERVRMFQFERVAALALAGLASALRPPPGATGAPYLACVAGCGPLGEFQRLTFAGFDRVVVLDAPGSTVTMPELEEWAGQLRGGATIEEVHVRIAAIGEGGLDVDRILALALTQADRPTDAYAVFSRLLAAPDAEDKIGLLSTGAMLALQAGEPAAAAILVERVLADSRCTGMDLRSAAQIAGLLRDPRLTLRAAEQLHAVYPDDELGLTLLAEEWYRAGEFSAAQSLLAPHAGRLGDDGLYVLAGASHRCEPCVGIHAFQAAVPAVMRSRAIADEIYCALAVKEWTRVDAAIEVIQPDCMYQAAIVRALCRALEVWCLSVDATVNDASLDHPLRWMHKAVELLASRPADVANRLRLEELTSPSALGETAFYRFLQPFVAAPADTGECLPAPDIGPADKKEQLAFMEFLRSQLAEQNHIYLVPKRLGHALDAATADRLVRGGMQIIEDYHLTPEKGDADLLSLLLSCLLNIVHTADDTTTSRGASLAIFMVHRVVTRLAMAGLGQAARDLVETVMYIAGSTREPAICADAWLALADMRQRGHQPMLALLALAHASRVLPSDPQRRLTYHAVAVRIMRDMRFTEGASEQMDAYESIADTQPGLAPPEQRISLGWSLTLAHATQHAGSATWASDHGPPVSSLVQAAFRTLVADNEAAPQRLVAASHLVHAIRLMRDHELPPPLDEVTLQDTLTALGAEIPGVFQALLTDTPSFEQLRRTVEASMTARHTVDLLPDTLPARVIARRILNGETDLASCAATLEVLSDLESGFSPAVDAVDIGVIRAATTRIFERARDGRAIDGIVDIISQPAPPRMAHRLLEVMADPQAFLAALLECSRAGVLLEATSLLAGGLGHLRIHQGEARWTMEPKTVFDPARLGEYERRFPNAFHTLDDQSFDPEGDVAHALRRLGVSSVPQTVALRCVVPDHQLLAIPANLQPIGTDLAGDQFPICQVPSLGWLREAHALRAQAPLPWDAKAWVLPNNPQKFAAPLTVGGDWLTEQLAPFGVDVQRDVALVAVKPAPVLWFMAHGGLSLDAEHFARVSSDLEGYQPAEDFVAAARGASLVVLLVCSAGLGSHERFTERVRGLPAELLRQGVRTVVASPWPIINFVGALWSGAFAQRLCAGETVAAAAFAANRTLGNRRPKDRLAMHVYGDPWLRFAAAGVQQPNEPDELRGQP